MDNRHRILCLITARGGSKGLPGKNIRPLLGKPLLHYSIWAARHVVPDHHICLSTDSREIIECAGAIGLEVPFVRPAELATDSATSESVVRHALSWYRTNRNQEFDLLVLLQPTSPLRTGRHIAEALSMMSEEVDMAVSVFETDANPYYVLMEPGPDGYLVKSKIANFTRRQDCPRVYQMNGAIYVIRISALANLPMAEIRRKVPYVMLKQESVDIDDMMDWKMAEMLLEERNSKKNEE